MRRGGWNLLALALTAAVGVLLAVVLFRYPEPQREPIHWPAIGDGGAPDARGN